MRYLCHLLVAHGGQVRVPLDHQGHVDIPALVSQPLSMFLGLIIIIKVFSFAFSLHRPVPTTDNLSNRNEFLSWLREHLRRQYSRALGNGNVVRSNHPTKGSEVTAYVSIAELIHIACSALFLGHF
jgi:hypothetical protein